MTTDLTDAAERLRKLALSVTRGELRRPWRVQDSNSFRRIGTDRGDGDVLCAVTQPADGHPDLHAATDVLDYIVAAHPFAILRLIRERDQARHALHILRRGITGHDQVFRDAGGMAGDYPGREELARVTEATIPGDAGDPTGSTAMAHSPIASYALGQGVVFCPGYGDRWRTGIVTRLESGLRQDRSAWYAILVRDRAGTYRFEDRDVAHVRPETDSDARQSRTDR